MYAATALAATSVDTATNLINYYGSNCTGQYSQLSSVLVCWVPAMTLLKLIAVILVLSLLTACSASEAGLDKKGDEKKQKSAKHEEKVETTTGDTAGQCDPALWQRVYDPSRLEVLSDC